MSTSSIKINIINGKCDLLIGHTTYKPILGLNVKNQNPQHIQIIERTFLVNEGSASAAYLIIFNDIKILVGDIVRIINILRNTKILNKNIPIKIFHWSYEKGHYTMPPLGELIIK